MCGLDNVPMGVWNDYTKAEGVDREDGMAGESDENNARIVVNGQRVRTDYRFNFEIWTMCNDVPVRMEPTFRLWEVARAFWRPDYPLTLYYRSVGTTVV